MSKHGNTRAIADYLANGYHHDQGQIPYFLKPNGGAITVDIGGLSAEGKQLARWALDAWSSLIDIEFRVVSGGATVTFGDDRPGANVAVSYLSNGVITSAHVNIEQSWIDRHGDTIDSYSFRTYLHEIGHLLGLGHTGDYSSASAVFDRDAVFSNDSWHNSVMSYFSQAENPNINASKAVNVSPMAADVLAARSVYGSPQDDPTVGRTVWGVNSNLDNYLGDMFRAMTKGDEAIYEGNGFTLQIADRGGRDRIDFSNDWQGQEVDLRPGGVSSILGQTDNLLITQGTVIEYYVAGRGADRIVGNGIGNNVNGSAQNDWINGLAGSDKLWGGSHDDTLIGAKGADRLFGQQGDDLLKGGAGNDVLSGGGRNDHLWGGRGADQFVFSGGKDTIVDFQDHLDSIRIDASRIGLTDTQVADALEAGAVVNGNVVFGFGNGHELKVRNVESVESLIGDVFLF